MSGGVITNDVELMSAMLRGEQIDVHTLSPALRRSYFALAQHERTRASFPTPPTGTTLYALDQALPAYIDDPRGPTKTARWRDCLVFSIPDGATCGSTSPLLAGRSRAVRLADAVRRLATCGKRYRWRCDKRHLAALKSVLPDGADVEASATPPQAVRRHVQCRLSEPHLRGAYDDDPSACTLCGGRGRFSDGAPCDCASPLTRIEPPLTDADIVDFYAAGRKFIEVKPWLHIRMNHSFRLVLKDGSERFMQLLGGTGHCHPQLHIGRRFKDLQKEDDMPDKVCARGASFLKASFQHEVHDNLNGLMTFTDLDRIEAAGLEPECLPVVFAQWMNSARTERPDAPKGEDPMGRRLPCFPPLSAPRSREDYVTITAAMAAMAEIVGRRVLLRAPGGDSGDYRRFFPLQQHILTDPLCRTVAHVSFPSLPKDALNRLGSNLQKVVVDWEGPSQETLALARAAAAAAAGGGGGGSGGFEPDEDEEVGLETNREANRTKEKGNEHYKAGAYEVAIGEYDAALTLLRGTFSEDRLRGTEWGAQNDRNIERTFRNIVSNKVQALFRLKRYEDVLVSAGLVLGKSDERTSSVAFVPTGRTECVMRCPYRERLLMARGRAAAKLGRLQEAEADFRTLGHFLRRYRRGTFENSSEKAQLEHMIAEVDGEITSLQAQLGALATSKMREWRRVTMAAGAQHCPARYRHTMVVAGDVAVIFGGETSIWGAAMMSGRGRLGDVWTLDLKTHALTHQACGGVVPKRAFHTAVYDAPRRRMLVFGGEAGDTSTPPENAESTDPCRARLLSLDLDTFVWSSLDTPGTPAMRHEHVAVLSRGGMWIFGGDILEHRASTGERNGTCGGLWRYDLVAGDWERLPDCPLGSRRDAAAWLGGTDGGSLLVLGGRTDGPESDGIVDFEGYTNDVVLFDLERRRWNVHPLRVAGRHGAACQFGQRAECMAARMGSTVVVFGGYAETSSGSRFYNDAWQLKETTLDGDDDDEGQRGTGIRLQALKPIPARLMARGHATLVADVARNRLLLVGGYNSMLSRCGGGGGGGGGAAEDARKPGVVFGDVWECVFSTEKAADVRCCAFCKKPAQAEVRKPLHCSRCKFVMYCDAECQRAHWPVHKLRCKKNKNKRRGKKKKKVGV